MTSEETFYESINIDEVVKSRHTGENRCPVFCNYSKFLDTGFRRYDYFVEFKVGGHSPPYSSCVKQKRQKACPVWDMPFVESLIVILRALVFTRRNPRC